jgi:Fe2+ transport system protein FeoA
VDDHQHVLSDSEPGELVRLARITEQVEVDLDALQYLSDHGFVPGTAATVRSKAPDGTLTLDVDGASMALGSAMSRQLYVVSGAPAGAPAPA